MINQTFYLEKTGRRILSCSLQALQTAVKVHPYQRQFQMDSPNIGRKMIRERADGKMEAEMLTNQNVCRRKHPNSYTMNKKKTLKIVMAPMHQHVHFLTANQHAAGNNAQVRFPLPALWRTALYKATYPSPVNLSHQSGKLDFRVLTPICCWSFFSQLGSFPQVGVIKKMVVSNNMVLLMDEIQRSPVEGTVVYSLSHQFTGFFDIPVCHHLGLLNFTAAGHIKSHRCLHCWNSGVK